MSAEQFDTMLNAQGSKCAICKTELILTGKGQSAIDHCHKSNRVRGILCGSCNYKLGFIEKVGVGFVIAGCEYLNDTLGSTIFCPPIKTKRRRRKRNNVK